MTVSETRTECPRCGSTSPSRALGGCFHSWHADPELRAEPSRGAPDAVAKLRAARTAWHEDFGVPISQEYANFLTAVGEVEDEHIAVHAELQRVYEVNSENARLYAEAKSGHVVLLEALRHALPILISAIAFVDCKAVVAEVRAAIQQAERT